MGLIKPSGSKISYTISPSDEQRLFSSTSSITESTTFVALKKVVWLGKPSTIRIKYRFTDYYGGRGAQAGIFVNGSLYSTYDESYSPSPLYIKKDIYVKKGDEIAIYGRILTSGSVVCDEMGVYYSIAASNVPVLLTKIS
ncbi:hypothetical protein [Bacillus sp. 1P06AnD]|uniref:hypothetical protein n=1 Tax=Bacillus sp. 1P06AnD TaxID=3132208 RepID=UPI0039A36119